MRYLSVCSGIEAASVAWEPLGWQPVGFSEIDPFPSAVLAHRFHEVTNHGDFTKIQPTDVGHVDLLVGGTPCQSFSIAGKRLGLDDPRGHLALEYLALAQRLKTRWLVWENVPGVLSHDKGRTFGTFVGLLGQCGFGWSYRVLDARNFGVAQSRRRVILVGHRGDWRRAAAVLFEPSSDSGADPACATELGGLGGVLPCLTKHGYGATRSEEAYILCESTGRIRRMTPIECERAQGFPDNWTQVPYRGKPKERCPLGPRGAACGNSMAVPVMRWLGKRIAAVDAIEGAGNGH